MLSLLLTTDLILISKTYLCSSISLLFRRSNVGIVIWCTWRSFIVRFELIQHFRVLFFTSDSSHYLICSWKSSIELLESNFKSFKQSSATSCKFKLERFFLLSSGVSLSCSISLCYLHPSLGVYRVWFFCLCLIILSFRRSDLLCLLYE